MSFLNVLALLVMLRDTTTLTNFDFPFSGSVFNVLYVYLYQVFDGDNVHFPLVGTFCGTSIPSYFVSSGNLLTIHFVTDSSVQRQGFNASYSAVPCKTFSTF